jgi:titin
MLQFFSNEPYTSAGDGDYSLVSSATTYVVAPTSATATGISTSQITVSWSDVFGESGYLIERSPNGASSWVQVGSTGANITTFANTGLSPGTQYYYRIRGYNVSGNGAYSPVASAFTYVDAPSSLAALPTSPFQINLSWSDVTGETGYKIERSPNGSSGWAQIATTGANVTSHSNTGVSSGTQYFYRVRGYNSAGDGAYSPTANTFTFVEAPSTLGATPISTSQIDLAWSDVFGETGYRIERSPNGTSGWIPIFITGANITTYSDTGLAAGTNYFYRVLGVNSAGNGPYSPIANTTTFVAAPTNLVALGQLQKIALSWTDLFGELGYDVERSPNGVDSWIPLASVGANTTTYTDSGLGTSVTFYYRVRGHNAAGKGAFSSVASATTSSFPSHGIDFEPQVPGGSGQNAPQAPGRTPTHESAVNPHQDGPLAIRHESPVENRFSPTSLGLQQALGLSAASDTWLALLPDELTA